MVWHAAPYMPGRRNQAAHHLLHAAFPTGWQAASAPWLRVDHCPTRQPSRRQPELTDQSPRTASVHAPGSLHRLWLGTEGLSAEQDMQASSFSSTKSTPPQNLCVIWARQQWALARLNQQGWRKSRCAELIYTACWYSPKLLAIKSLSHSWLKDKLLTVWKCCSKSQCQ